MSENSNRVLSFVAKLSQMEVDWVKVVGFWVYVDRPIPLTAALVLSTVWAISFVENAVANGDVEKEVEVC